MQVPVQISFHGLDTSEAVEARIREKTTKLERLYDRITGCRVVVEKHHAGRSNLAIGDRPYHISIFLEVPGGELVVKRDPKDRDALKDHEDVNIALRDAFNAMERQLRDFVGRRWRDVHPQKVQSINT